jgi:hypothetical protein
MGAESDVIDIFGHHHTEFPRGDIHFCGIDQDKEFRRNFPHLAREILGDRSTVEGDPARLVDKRNNEIACTVITIQRVSDTKKQADQKSSPRPVVFWFGVQITGAFRGLYMGRCSTGVYARPDPLCYSSPHRVYPACRLLEYCPTGRPDTFPMAPGIIP